MQNDPTTNTQTKYLVDEEDWEIAFQAFEGRPYEALRLGFNLATLRTELAGRLITSRPVMEALDVAMEVLFPYTSFHEVSVGLFLRYTEGSLDFEEEQMLKALGVKI